MQASSADFLYSNGGTYLNEDRFGELRRPVKVAIADPKAMEVWRLSYEEERAEADCELDAVLGTLGLGGWRHG